MCTSSGMSTDYIIITFGLLQPTPYSILSLNVSISLCEAMSNRWQYLYRKWFYMLYINNFVQVRVVRYSLQNIPPINSLELLQLASRSNYIPCEVLSFLSPQSFVFSLNANFCGQMFCYFYKLYVQCSRTRLFQRYTLLFKSGRK